VARVGLEEIRATRALGSIGRPAEPNQGFGRLRIRALSPPDGGPVTCVDKLSGNAGGIKQEIDKEVERLRAGGVKDVQRVRVKDRDYDIDLDTYKTTKEYGEWLNVRSISASDGLFSIEAKRPA
jgi:hypothetical protein